MIIIIDNVYGKFTILFIYMARMIMEEEKMEKNTNKGVKNEISLPQPSSSDLRGRQSVRATFKLTEKAIYALSIVSAHLGIKQKSLFDHLIDDNESLGLIANEIKSDQFHKLNRVQKTYVLSRKTLTCLEEASRNFDAPRDALVEYSIQRLLPVIKEEKEKHEKRKEVLGDMNRYLKQGEKILSKVKNLLGEDDPVYDRYKTAMTIFQSAHKNIEFFIKKGEMIEEF